MSENSAISVSNVFDHVLLSALWGASFLFMRVAAPEFGPIPLIGLRCAIGAITLIVLLSFAGSLRDLNQNRWTGMAVGVTNSAIPFVLIAFAALTIASGVLSTVFYGFSANFAKKYLQGSQPMVNAANSQIGAALVLAIPTVLLWPSAPVSLVSWVSLIILGVFSTGYAYVLYFRLINQIGASRAITVVFVVPLFGVAFGWLLLDESLSAAMFVAGAVIILGSVLSLKLLPLGKRA